MFLVDVHARNFREKEESILKYIREDASLMIKFRKRTPWEFQSEIPLPIISYTYILT